MVASGQASDQVATMVRASILAAFALALGYPAHQRADAQPRAAENNDKAAEKALPASTAAIENQLASIASAIKGARTGPESKAAEDRAERDLKAQQDMAKWAMWMFAAAALTAFLTAAGVLLVWRTLIQTRRAAKYAGVGARQARRAAIASDRMAEEAAKATLAAVKASKAGQEANRLTREQVALSEATAQKQLRAYMGTLGAAVIETNSANPQVIIDVQNFGQTPAYELRHYFIINLYSREPDGKTRRTVYNVPNNSLGMCEPRHVQNVGAVLDLPINAQTIGMDAELTLTFTDVFGVKRWRRMTYQLTRHSCVADDRIVLNTAEEGNNEGEGTPPQTALVTGPEDPRA